MIRSFSSEINIETAAISNALTELNVVAHGHSWMQVFFEELEDGLLVNEVARLVVQLLDKLLTICN